MVIALHRTIEGKMFFDYLGATGNRRNADFISAFMP